MFGAVITQYHRAFELADQGRLEGEPPTTHDLVQAGLKDALAEYTSQLERAAKSAVTLSRARSEQDAFFRERDLLDPAPDAPNNHE